MTDTIQVCCDVHLTRVFIIDIRPDETTVLQSHQQCDVNYREIRRDRWLFVGTRTLCRGHASIYSPMKFAGPCGSPTNLAIVHIALLVVSCVGLRSRPSEGRSSSSSS